jgi:hypothetical protein
MLIQLVVSELCPDQEKRKDGRTTGRTKRRLYANYSGGIKSQTCKLLVLKIKKNKKRATSYQRLTNIGKICNILAKNA